MSSAYWAGAFPGLVLATIVSVALVKTLARAALKHVVWLVPGLHFAGAFLFGPAMSLLYGLVFVPSLGRLAPWVWAGVASLLLGVVPGVLAWRAGGVGRGVRVAACLGAALATGWLLPPVYHLLAG